MMTPTEPRLVLKATPPRHSRQILDRPRLSADTLGLWDKPIVRLEAQAGFGKTSLLSQWRREWLAAGAYVAWVNLDEDDNTPARFTQALAFAMEQATGSKAFARIRTRATTGSEDMDRMTEWLAEVASLGADCVLVLDEGERLPSSTVRHSLPYLFTNLPPNLHVILAMRGRPQQRASEAGVRSPVMRLSAGALRFTLEETIAALQARFGDQIDAEAAQRIHEVTEGWPLGLQLFVSALEQGRSVPETLALAGQSGKLRKQFVASLLSHLPPDQMDFLVRISILERIHADLCAALTGRVDCTAMLDTLRDTTPILAGDLEGNWLRLHGLVRAYLRESFDALPAGQRKAAHAAAAAWLDEGGFHEEGARQALAAGLQGWAWEMAEKSLLGMMERGQVDHVDQWLERAPLPREQQPPRLLTMAAWCCVLNGRPEEASRLAERVMQHPRADGTDRLRASVALSSAAIFRDDLDLADRLIARWRSAVEADPVIDRFNGFNQLAWLALHRGDTQEAQRLLRLPQGPGQRPFLMETYTAAIWGSIHLSEGRPELAIEALEPFSRRADAEIGRRGNPPATLAGLLALALCESGRNDEAEATLAGRLDVLETLGAPISLLSGYVAASRIAALRGEHARAHAILETLFAVGERRRLPRARCVALRELIRQHSLLGHGQICAQHLLRFHATLAAVPQFCAGLWSEVQQVHLGLASAWTARALRHWNQLTRALDAVASLAQKRRFGRDLVEIELLRAQALEATGGDAAASRESAMGLAASLGLKSMLPAPDAPAGEHPPTPTRRDSATARVVPTPMLTPTEQRILGMLAERLSNKEMADRLDVGATTIKWHLKNAYSKLNAGSRDHAVQRARMLGILATH